MVSRATLRNYLVLCILLEVISTLLMSLSYRETDTKSDPLPVEINKGDEFNPNIVHSVPTGTSAHNWTSFRTAEDTCVTGGPVKHFLMTKTEKTGSTTAYGVLARYALKNRLEILMPADGLKIDWSSPKGWMIRPRRRKRADVLIHHAVYNQTMIDKYVMADVKRITLVREPVSWFISAVNFFQWRTGSEALFPKFMTPHEVLWDNAKLYKRRGFPVESWFHIPQLLWSGFDYRLRDNLTAIKEHIDFVVNRSDVIILSDQFDASLVILRRKFCWSYTDILYTKYKVKNSVKRFNLTTAGVNKLLSWRVNLGDQMFYEKLSGVWWSQPELKGDFWDEVSYFSQLNLNATTRWCKIVWQSQKYLVIPASRWHGQLRLTRSVCNLAANPNENYLENKMRIYVNAT